MNRRFRMMTVFVLIAALALAGCNALKRDLEDLCQAASEVEQRPGLGVGSKIQAITAQALKDARSETFGKIILATVRCDPERCYEIVRVGAASAGVPEWTCSALERLYSLKETISIRGSRILVNGKAVATASQGPDPAIPCDRRIDALAAALRPLAAGRPQGTLVLAPETTSPYCLISQILHTAWSVEFKRVLLGDLFAMAVNTKQREALKEEVRLRLSLVVGGPGIVLAGSGGHMTGKDGTPWTVGCLRELEQGRCPTTDGRGGSYDYRHLREQLEQIKRKFPNARDIAVTMDDATPYHVLGRLVGIMTGGEKKQGFGAHHRFYISLGTVEQLNKWLGFEAFERQRGAITSVPWARRTTPRQRIGLGDLTVDPQKKK